MIELSPGGLLWIILLIFIIFKKIDFSYYALVFTSVLTTVALVYLNGENILLFQVVFLITVIKFFLQFFNKKILCNISPLFFLFIIYCGLSIPFSLFHENTIVKTINGAYSNVHFNYQQFTQYAYLVIGFVTAVIGNVLLTTEKINFNSLNRILTIAYIFTLTLALLQHILPLDLVNKFIRNGVNVGYNTKEARISGTFVEPSSLALYCAPLFAGYAYKVFCSLKVRYAVLLLLFIIVTLDNKSSSAVLGIIFTALFLMIFRFKKRKHSKKELVWYIVFLIFIVIAFVTYFNIIGDTFDVLIKKLNGEGVSGSDRMESMLYHMRVGFSNVIPIGYGTVRSYDLLSTWLCEIGILGVLMYFLILFSLCKKLLIIRSEDSMQLFLNIIIHNIIMFVSVCEIMFLSIWIYYGMAYYIIKSEKNKV